MLGHRSHLELQPPKVRPGTQRLVVRPPGDQLAKPPRRLLEKLRVRKAAETGIAVRILRAQAGVSPRIALHLGLITECRIAVNVRQACERPREFRVLCCQLGQDLDGFRGLAAHQRQRIEVLRCRILRPLPQAALLLGNHLLRREQAHAGRLEVRSSDEEVPGVLLQQCLQLGSSLRLDFTGRPLVVLGRFPRCLNRLADLGCPAAGNLGRLGQGGQQ